MAEFSAAFNVDSLSLETQSLDIDNDIKLELVNCLQTLSGLNFSDIGKTAERRNQPFKYDDVIIGLSKFATAAIGALEACQLLPFPFGMICKVIAGAVEYIFKKDVASVVIERFIEILEADLIAKCRATCTKIALCITYMQGLPSVDGLQQSEKLHHLQLLASDVPIQTGLDEILFLGEKIKQMVDAADVEKANKLFEHAQLYCCLATTRELFLLYRFAIQSAFSNEASSVRNVLSAQKTNDSCVLRFLFKPTVGSLKLFYCLFHKDWLILRHFLDRHRLVIDDLSELSGRFFRMRTLRGFYKVYRMPILEEVRTMLFDRNYRDRSIFEFRAVANKQNVFTIWSHITQPPRQVYCNTSNRLCVKDEGDNISTADNAVWYILRVHPEKPEESTCYMIWLGTDFKRRLQTSWNRDSLGATSSADPSRDNLWILERVIKVGNIFI